jgi:hypothetical protein
LDGSENGIDNPQWLKLKNLPYRLPILKVADQSGLTGSGSSLQPPHNFNAAGDLFWGQRFGRKVGRIFQVNDNLLEIIIRWGRSC